MLKTSEELIRTLRSLYILSLNTIWVNADLFDQEVLTLLEESKLIRLNKAKNSVCLTAEGVGAYLNFDDWSAIDAML